MSSLSTHVFFVVGGIKCHYFLSLRNLKWDMACLFLWVFPYALKNLKSLSSYLSLLMLQILVGLFIEISLEDAATPLA